MDKADTYLDTFPGARIVRWPFRLLAAVLVSAALFALLSSAYKAAVYHDLTSALFVLLLLPLTALLVRAGGGAVLLGRVVVAPFWPFASGYVALAWVVIFFATVKYFQYA